MATTATTPSNGTGNQNQTAKLVNAADHTDKLPSATTNTPAIENLTRRL